MSLRSFLFPNITALMVFIVASVTLTSCDENLALNSLKVGLTDSKAALPPVFSPEGASYGPAQLVSISTPTVEARIFYTTDGSDPTAGSKLYESPIEVSSSQTLRAIAKIGRFKASTVSTEIYVINGAAAKPTAAVTDGSCGAPKTVTLSSATNGAVVHYTSGDGSQSDPTCASPTGPISLTDSITIKAISCKANFSNSAVATFSYSVETQNGQFCGGDGTAGAPYRICNLETLANIAANLSASYIITRDIDASSTSTSNSGAGWAPIGTTAAPFTGTLNGQDHLICGIKINKPTTNYVGLFGLTSASSTIKNISFTDVGIVGNNYAGSIAGQTSGVIQNVAVQGSIQGFDHVGGIVGILLSATGSLVESNAHSIAVSGTTHIGGVAGEIASGSIITRSWSSGTVTGDYSGGSKIGGLVGRLSDATISRSSSSTTVNGNTEVGGLVGKSYKWGAGTCLIEYSHASGSVTSRGETAINGGFGDGAGGLLGVSGECLIIRKSYATGNVTSDHLTGAVLGGLIGQTNWGGQQAIQDSYATGNVSYAGSNGHIGGLSGYLHGNISRSYATGAVNGSSSKAAGLTLSASSISDSFSTGIVTGMPGGTSAGLISSKKILSNSFWLKPGDSLYSCFAVDSNTGSPATCTEVSDISFFSQPGGSLFSTWDFDTVWYFPEGGGLPLLRE